MGAGEEQIAIAQPVWARLFSHWAEWRDVLRKAIDAYDASQGAVGRFEEAYLPKGTGSEKAWTTSLVFGEPRTYGRLPHPQGRCQDAVLNMLPADIQNQIF